MKYYYAQFALDTREREPSDEEVDFMEKDAFFELAKTYFKSNATKEIQYIQKTHLTGQELPPSTEKDPRFVTVMEIHTYKIRGN